MKMRNFIWIILALVGFFGIGIISAMGGLVIHEYFDFPWQKVYSAIVVGLFIAVWYICNILYTIYIAYNLKKNRL